MHFKGKVIWITGASSGIGKELVYQLAKLEAIIIMTSRNRVALELIQKDLQVQGVISHILAYDLMNIEAIPQLVEQAISLEGKIDAVIQCAGISQRSLGVETDFSVYQKLMQLNYFAPVAISQAILPHFKKNDSGNLVVISSIAGMMGFPLRSGYAASKHAIKGYLETLQTELYDSKVNLTLVFPGRIDTAISKNALTGTGVQAGVEDANNKVGMSVQLCVLQIIQGLKANKKTIYIGKPERLLLWIWWFFPNLYLKIAHKTGLKR